MPALTVRAITKALSDYVRPDEDIVAKLNLVMPRLYALGNWRDLVYDWTIETDNDYFALPEDSEMMMAAMVSDAPQHIASRWHDYRTSGYAANGPYPVYGVVDDGWHATKEDIDIDATADSFGLTFDPVTPDTALPSEGAIRITGWRETSGDTERDSQTTEIITLDGTSTMSSAYTDWHEITEIAFEDVHQWVDVIAVEGVTDLATMARVRGDGVARYRRFRFSNPSEDTKGVRLLLKRAWVPVQTEDDLVYLGDLNAIKHGLLGMLAEDNADLQRSSYHWGLAQQLLENELTNARGPAKPRVKFDPTGLGSESGVPNIL